MNKIKLALRSVKSSGLATHATKPFYARFSVTGAVGSLISCDYWTTRLNNPPNVEVDPLGRTKITTLDDGPIYIVNRATTRDFKKLSKESGFSLEGAQSVQVSSKILSSKVRVSITLLQFDEDRLRIGEIKVAAGKRTHANLHPKAKYLLPTLRMSGKGTTLIEWLKIESSPNLLSNKENGRVLGGVRDLPPGSMVGNLDADLAEVEKVLGRVKATVGDLALFGASIERSPSNINLATGHDEHNVSQELVRTLLLDLGKTIPDSNGSALFKPLNLSVAIITDDFMYNFYRPAFRELHYLSPDNYETIFSTQKIDAVLYVTTWKGMEGEEWRGIKFREKPAEALEQILSLSSSRGIPTIFQSKEDPSNFEYFLPIARKFDYIFTTDSDIIGRYEAETEAKGVFFGEYGVNPIINNPIGSFRVNINKMLFAGSYPEKYPERVSDMKVVFDSIPERNDNLVIFDRNFGTDTFQFPSEYAPSRLAPIGNVDLQKVHKLFRYSLNFNSIKNSATMCAMRVYQLQAQGKPLISNYALSTYNLFPGVRIVPHPTVLDEVQQNEWDYLELEQANRQMVQVLWQRNVYRAAREMMVQVGIDVGSDEESDIRVLVLSHGDLAAVEAVVRRQTFKSVEIMPLSTFDFDADVLSGFHLIAPMTDSLSYSDDYLLSRVAAFVYSDSHYVTQSVFFEGASLPDGPIHEFVQSTSERFATVFQAACLNQEGRKFIEGRVCSFEGNGYAADPFGVGFSDFVRANAPAVPETGYALSVIIPVYNNGEFLITKCLPSLRRNEIYTKMEILLVDDGSIDGITERICRQLSKDYPNIVYYRFGDGGSGSASRPRNKGVELASSELISFLDPDNEISSRGYDSLVKEYLARRTSGDGSEFVSGYQVKVGESSIFTGRHTNGEPRLVKDARSAFFSKGKFPVVSTQAAVIDREFLRRHAITYVEGAAGQDTLYGWEVLEKAKNPVFVSNAYIIYYAERAGSVTNSVTSEWFARCLKLEHARKAFLEENGLLDIYMEKKYQPYMTGWYLKKLENVEECERAESVRLLEDIAGLYGRTMETQG